MITIQKRFINNRINRPALRDGKKYAIRQIKGIIAHWTANPSKGADAAAHQRFFDNVSTYTSAHYFIDDHQIIQIIPDSEVAYHVGAKINKTDGQRLIGDSTLNANYFVIGFEMCVNSDGNWGKTYANSVRLAAHLLHKYRFGLNDLYRHHDITGKDCPRMMLSRTAWERFRMDVGKAMRDLLPAPLRLAKVNARGLNVRRGPSTRYKIVDILKNGEEVEIIGNSGTWQQIGREKWVFGAYLDVIQEAQDALIINETGANIRSGPGMNYNLVDRLPKGAWVTVLKKSQNWYSIGTGRWLYRTLIDIVSITKANVTGTSFLNVRQGPSTRYSITRVLRRGDEVEVFEKVGAWKRIGISEWVYGGFLG